MLGHVKAISVNVNIVQVYAPTSERKEEVNNFYVQVTTRIKNIPKEEILIIMGDLNAK